MRRMLIQRLIVTLCLAAFALGQTVFASVGVWCTDAEGTSRIEYACFKSPQGTCLSPCAEPDVHATSEVHEDEPLSPFPCEDTPLGPQLTAVRILHSDLAVGAGLESFTPAISCDARTFEPDATVVAVGRNRERRRPPDSLDRLRSVVLVL